MRVLFATTAGTGHFGPLVPFARACRDAGHEVMVAAPESFAPAVRQAGLDHAPFADPRPEVIGPVYGRLSQMSFEEANATVIGEIFGRLDAQAALPGMTDLVGAWRPDVVLREPCEFASLVAADRAGVPQVQVAIGMSATGDMILPMLAEPLAELSALAGLPDDRAMAALTAAEGFSTVPSALDRLGNDDSGPDPIRRFRDPAAIAVGSRLPAPWGDPDHPLVYVTFGSVAARQGPFAAVFRATLDALADAPVRVLLTTGDGDDDLALGPVPANARVERWWPQAGVLPEAAAVVGHGGFGTTMGALAAGLPQVIVPLFALDQVVNGERVAAAGAGVLLSGGPISAPEIPSALSRVLTEPAYRAGARAVAADIAALPDMADSVRILEELAAG